jgi:hypothetical protein
MFGSRALNNNAGTEIDFVLLHVRPDLRARNSLTYRQPESESHAQALMKRFMERLQRKRWPRRVKFPVSQPTFHVEWFLFWGG